MYPVNNVFNAEGNIINYFIFNAEGNIINYFIFNAEGNIIIHLRTRDTKSLEMDLVTFGAV